MAAGHPALLVLVPARFWCPQGHKHEIVCGPGAEEFSSELILAHTDTAAAGKWLMCSEGKAEFRATHACRKAQVSTRYHTPYSRGTRVVCLEFRPRSVVFFPQDSGSYTPRAFFCLASEPYLKISCGVFDTSF